MRSIVAGITRDIEVCLYGDLGNIFPRNLLRCFVISGLPVKWTVKSIKTACFSAECTRRYESYRKESGREQDREKSVSTEGNKKCQTDLRGEDEKSSSSLIK